MNLLSLLDNLSSDDPAVRDPAERQLHEMGMGVIRPLFRICRREKSCLLPDLDYFVLLTGVFCLIPLFVGAAVALLENVVPLRSVAPWFVLLLAYVWVYKRVVDRRMRRRDARKRLAQRRLTTINGVLDRIEDVRAVGALLDAMGGPQDLSFAPVPLLIRLLPRMNAEDAGVLSTRNRALLHSLLQPYYGESQPDFTLAILKAMEQIGDARSAERLRRLSNTSARTPTLRQICAAARDSLALLEARLERERCHGVLLRPSKKPNESALLLQPARAEPPSAPEQLLRVVEDGDDRS